jgi:hypothetical protein
MCRGANLGICCEAGCDERIRCQDTGGYCPGHDPMDWEGPSNNVADDPEKRRVYTVSQLRKGISRLEVSIEGDQRKLEEYRDRVKELTA